MEEKEFYKEFKPLIRNSYYQTILSSAIDFKMDIRSKTEYVTLKDKDIIALEVSKPKNWNPGGWMIVMVHGLCGSHKSHYIKRIAHRMFDQGVLVVRINLRGCGSGKGLAKGIYHSGCSRDIEKVMEHLIFKYPDSKRFILGFSLGGNITLKHLGELGHLGLDYFKFAIAITPPVDLFSSARHFMKAENRWIGEYFLKNLIKSIYDLHRRFKDLPRVKFPKNMTINELDELYIAPRSNFSSVSDYYRLCSSKNVIKSIHVPTKILFAKDDPIISSNVLDSVNKPQNIKIYKTDFGGHMGYIGMNLLKDFRWLDTQILLWINNEFNKH